MKEVFTIPSVGAIIRRQIEGEKCILMQTRSKADGGASNGLLEIPAGKIREYEGIYDALRREIREKTGLTVTDIQGESDTMHGSLGGYELISFTPYCITQNLCGGYSLIVNVFLCTAQGEPVLRTDETTDIHWEKEAVVRKMLLEQPQTFFPMHFNALRKYLLTD